MRVEIDREFVVADVTVVEHAVVHLDALPLQLLAEDEGVYAGAAL